MGDDTDQVADVVGIVVPVAAGRWLSLLIKTGARPLARNSRARLVPTISFSPGPLQNPESLFCVRTSSSAPRRYQSFWPKKRTPASRPARSSP